MRKTVTPQAANASPSYAYGTFAFALGALFFGYAFIQRVAPSVMTQELMREFSVGAAALGSLSAFYFYSYAAIQLPVGMLTDYFGPRKLMSVAAALCALASLLFMSSDALWPALLGRALIGATVAFAFVGSLAIAANWCRPAHYALLAGLLQAIGMSGAIFGQAPLRYLVEAQGWRSAVGWLAALAILLAVLLWLCVPRRSPQQRGHRPIAAQRASLWLGLRTVGRNRQTWICALIGFGMSAPLLAFAGLWAVPWLHDVHAFSQAQAAQISSFFFLGAVVASPLHGYCSNRIGRRKPVLATGAALGLLAFSGVLLLPVTSAALSMALMFVAGAGGSAMVLCFSVVREHNLLNYSGTASGLMNMCLVGSGAVMQPLIGWLLDWQWAGRMHDGARYYSPDDYAIALSSLLVANALACAAVYCLRETHCRSCAPTAAAETS